MESQNLGDIMIDYLSSNSDKLYTMTALYNEIISSNSSLEIKDTVKRNEFNEKFRIEFLTLENKYKGVYRFIINERQYIIWSLETYDNLYQTHIKNTQENRTESYTNAVRTETNSNAFRTETNSNAFRTSDLYINTEIETTNYYEMIKCYINSGEYKYIYGDIKVDGINNAIHLFVINNDITNLKKISNIHKIDWTLKNRNNKSCLELARENKNCEMIEYILTNIHDESILNLKNIMESQKSIQKEIYDRSNKISLENFNLINENQELNSTNQELEVKYNRFFKFILITGISLIFLFSKKILSDY
jgi:hypothetical protein